MPPIDSQETELGAALLSQARTAIAIRLGTTAPPAREHPAMNERGASFVTLTSQGQLRGCIGQLEPSRTLGRDVRENAVAAAMRDPRFAPLSAEEWPHIAIEVSVLGPVELQPCASEEDCLAAITPGEDGVILSSGCHRATFLPQVWEQLPTPHEFIAQLLRKAGLSAHPWPADMMLGRYRVSKYCETATPQQEARP